MRKALFQIAIGILVATAPLFGAFNLNAPFGASAPVIDGTIGDLEWQDANYYPLVFMHYADSARVVIPVYLLNNGQFLYVASKVPFATNPYFWYGVYVDGDHSHTINSSMIEPHIDIDYNKAGTSSPVYPYYDAYRVSLPPDCATYSVPSPTGAEHAFSGTTALSFEWKIPLSDLTAQPGDTIGLRFVVGPNSTDTYNWVSFDYCDPSKWPNLILEKGKPVCGDANCDSVVDISDVVYLIAYIFSGGLAPCAGCK